MDRQLVSMEERAMETALNEMDDEERPPGLDVTATSRWRCGVSLANQAETQFTNVLGHP